MDKDKTSAPSDSSSIGTHILDITKKFIPSPRCVQDILASHPYNNLLWARTNPCDVLVDTINSTEGLAGAISRIRIMIISQIKNVIILDEMNNLLLASTTTS